MSNIAKFSCELCDYHTSRKSQYERHLDTSKHKSMLNPATEKSETVKTFSCHCGKTYKHSSTMYAHRKTCPSNSSLSDKEIIEMLVTLNAQLTNVIKQNNLSQQHA